jgi:hypothetical protein
MDPWADGRLEIAGTRAETAVHLADAFLHDPLHCSPPARMKHSHRPALCVHQNYWQTIGGENCQQEIRSLRHQAVAGQSWLRNFRNAMNKVRVDLPDGDQWQLAPLPDGSELAEKGGPILFHGAPRILPGKAKIQTSPAIDFGKSARPRAEAVDQPGNGCKRIRLQNFD